MKRLPRALLAFTAVFAFLFCLVSFSPLVPRWIQWLSTPWGDQPAEVILILGGDEQNPGELGYSTFIRLNYAVRYWRQGKVRTFLVSGGAGSGLAEAMRDFLKAHGVPEHAIQLDPASRNTWENIRNSKPLLTALPGSRALLTSDFHMRRAMGVCRRQGLSLQPLCIPDLGKRSSRFTERWPVLFLLVEETVKLGWYRWQGWG